MGLENLPETLYIQLDNTGKDNKRLDFFTIQLILCSQSNVFALFSLLFCLGMWNESKAPFSAGRSYSRANRSIVLRLSVFLKILPAKSLPELCWSLTVFLTQRNLVAPQLCKKLIHSVPLTCNRCVTLVDIPVG